MSKDLIPLSECYKEARAKREQKYMAHCKKWEQAEWKFLQLVEAMGASKDKVRYVKISRDGLGAIYDRDRTNSELMPWNVISISGLPCGCRMVCRKHLGIYKVALYREDGLYYRRIGFASLNQPQKLIRILADEMVKMGRAAP